MAVPKLRFKREDGTEYPEWKTNELKTIFPKIRNGFVGTVSDSFADKETGIRYIEGTNIHNGIISDDVEIYVTKAFHENHLNSQLKADDIVMVQSGHIGDCAVVGAKYAGSNCHALIIMSNGGHCDSRFYSFYFHCDSGYNKMKMYMQGNTVKHILASDMQTFIVPIPDLEEQQKIADFLSTVDEVIAQSEAEVQNLEQQKKAAMQKIFSQEVRFKREDGTDYSEWNKTAISELFEISAGGDIDKANSVKEYSENYPYAVYANALTNKGLYGYANYYKVECDCFTVTGRGDVGYAIARHEKFVPIVRLLVCIPKHNENVDYFAEIVNYTKILVESTGVPQLTSIQLGKIKVVYPTDTEEQQKIADFLSAYDEAISYAKQELDKWKELKKGLLQQMFV